MAKTVQRVGDFSIAVPQAFGSFSKVRFSAHALLQVSLGVGRGAGLSSVSANWLLSYANINFSLPTFSPATVLDFLLFIYCVH